MPKEDSSLISSHTLFLVLASAFALSMGCAGPADGGGDDPDERVEDAGGSSDAGREEDTGGQGGEDAGRQALEGCELLCEENNLALIVECLTEGEEFDAAECRAACAQDGLEGVAECVDEAEVCGDIRLCFVDDSYTPVSFAVEGTDATMTGVIDFRTIAAVEALLRDHPGVTRIVMQDVPGSADDTSNLQASRMIREAGLSTWVPADGEIASGGVDFFCAGVARGADVAGGARLGVHSWGGGEGLRGDRLPRDHETHRPYLEYYEEMGIPSDFYWFTLEAAPPEGIHWMSVEEVELYGLTTE